MTTGPDVSDDGPWPPRPDSLVPFDAPSQYPDRPWAHGLSSPGVDAARWAAYLETHPELTGETWEQWAGVVADPDAAPVEIDATRVVEKFDVLARWARGEL